MRKVYDSGPPLSGQPGAAVLHYLIPLVAAIQVFLAIRFYGFLTGDDVEVLEEAFRCAAGLEYIPWNVRNLFVPDIVVSPFVFIARSFGVRDPAHLIDAATIPFIALG